MKSSIPDSRFWAFVRKEFLHVFRDRKTLLMLFGVPVVCVTLFGFALTNEIRNAKIVVCDYANDDASRQIIGKLAASREFQLQNPLLDYNQIETAFKQGDIKMAVVFPANFNRDLLHLNEAQIQLITDASDPNTATALSGYATNIIMDYQQELIQLQGLPYTINTEMRMVYNPELKSVVNFVPGVISLILLLVCVLMTSVSIVKEKESGTMEVLLVSPFSPFGVIVSKAVPYLALSLINLTVILLLSIFVLGMPVNGSFLLLYAVSTLFIITALSLGLLISNITTSQQAAMLVSLMGMLVPSILFTGFMFPLENMPYVLQLFANIVPAKWYYIIVKSVMIKGLGFEAIWKETLVLLGMTILLLVVNIRKFKIRLE
ncbi:ABC transporter permease [Proteiniphilum acetatigenes]|uniref:ABC transporter permease n=1 Tax=Proteiniphilum acetatigenes TaxID=294710 RepID=UPI00036FA725|nr:ABC transporter permease [Proteiniphilum acetatigenes]SFL24017.1 ABC-2 type transport system permease protein [Porphyromonadaceae bacterium KH3CP3RA]